MARTDIFGLQLPVVDYSVLSPFYNSRLKLWFQQSTQGFMSDSSAIIFMGVWRLMPISFGMNLPNSQYFVLTSSVWKISLFQNSKSFSSLNVLVWIQYTQHLLDLTKITTITHLWSFLIWRLNGCIWPSEEKNGLSSHNWERGSHNYEIWIDLKNLKCFKTV